MKKYSDLKYTIIGMGYLMEYIYPCYENFLGEKIRTNINAVTVDEKDLERKQEKLGFNIILNDNMRALKENNPDVILFAPPPKIAPILTEEVLVPYYEYLRSNNKPLPILYAFPPNPTGKFYLEKLGEDIKVANILPNMVSEIAGKKLVGEGLTYITFPDERPWEAEDVKTLEDFFKPLGGCIEVKPKHVMQMLAGTVTIHNISETIFTITDAINSLSEEKTVEFNSVASAMRYYHTEKRNYHVENSYPCSKNDVNEVIYEALRKVTFHWFEGIKKFYLAAGMEEETANTILVSLLDLHLHVHQEETRETIEKNTKQHATKGGVLEKGCNLFGILVEDGLRNEFIKYPQLKISDAWCEWLENKAYQITEAVSNHSKTLASNIDKSFEIENHAVMYGLLVKNAIKVAGYKGKEAAGEATAKSAYERGYRMRQRCLANGDEPTMINYMAYGEWRPQPGQMCIETLEKSPVNRTQVTLCPWCVAWKKYELMEYAKYYCDYVDYNLVKGFNMDLRLDMGQVLTRGAESCKFTWNGADLNEENEINLVKKREALGDQSIMNWEYHTSHIYYSTVEAYSKSLDEKEVSEIIRKVRADYSVIFGETALNVIDSFASTDFKTAIYNR